MLMGLTATAFTILIEYQDVETLMARHVKETGRIWASIDSKQKKCSLGIERNSWKKGPSICGKADYLPSPEDFPRDTCRRSVF
jgi:hypothetical protein